MYSRSKFRPNNSEENVSIERVHMLFDFVHMLFYFVVVKSCPDVTISISVCVEFI